MIDQLYQKAILKQAAAAVGHGEMDNPDHSLTVHNPLCGDRITVYLKMDDQQISNFSHNTKACVLCQASASILAQQAIGETADSIKEVFDKLKQSLDDNNWPEEKTNHKWGELNIFQPVSDHKNRFTCVTLPFESLLKAIKETTT